MSATLTVDDVRTRGTLNADDAAGFLGVSRDAIYDAVARHELPSLRLGRRVLIPTGPLLTLLGQNTVEAP